MHGVFSTHYQIFVSHHQIRKFVNPFKIISTEKHTMKLYMIIYVSRATRYEHLNLCGDAPPLIVPMN